MQMNTKTHYQKKNWEPRVKSVQYILTLFVKTIFDKECEHQQLQQQNH